MSTIKEKYGLFVNELKLPVFYQPWWLDIVASGGSWDVSIIESNNGKTLGVLPYFTKSYFWRKVIIMPPFTPYLGPWIRYGSENNYDKNKLEKEVISALIDQLPKVSLQMFKLHPCMPNTNPFSWAGYDNGVKQTYILQNIKDHKMIFSQMKGKLRSDIRNAEKTAEISLVEDFSVFEQFMEESFSSRGRKNPYQMDLFNKLDKALNKKSQRIMLKSSNEKGTTAMTYAVIDDHVAYYIAGTYNPKNLDRTALSFLIYQTIIKASHFVDTFDFEGSSIKSIERFFRSFGGTLTPYYRVYKSSNLLVKTIASFKNPDFR